MKRRFLSDLRRMCATALASGGRQLSASTILWPIAGNCERPYVTVMLARPSKHDMEPREVFVGEGSEVPMELRMETRCRECPKCLNARRNLWSHRAAAESRHWERTWFGTITLNPESHFRFLTLARAKYAPNGDFDLLPQDQQFRLIDGQIWPELNKMFKRIRKNHGHPLRYFIVAEAHKSGIPHYHCLIHQCTPEPLPYRSLERQWPHGFTKWRLIKSVAEARYTAKYCSKSSLARVRASLHYGEMPIYNRSDDRNVALPEREELPDHLN